jgi:hypothetical protein
MRNDSAIWSALRCSGPYSKIAHVAALTAAAPIGARPRTSVSQLRSAMAKGSG